MCGALKETGERNMICINLTPKEYTIVEKELEKVFEKLKEVQGQRIQS